MKYQYYCVGLVDAQGHCDYKPNHIQCDYCAWAEEQARKGCCPCPDGCNGCEVWEQINEILE